MLNIYVYIYIAYTTSLSSSAVVCMACEFTDRTSDASKSPDFMLYGVCVYFTVFIFFVFCFLLINIVAITKALYFQNSKWRCYFFCLFCSTITAIRIGLMGSTKCFWQNCMTFAVFLIIHHAAAAAAACIFSFNSIETYHVHCYTNKNASISFIFVFSTVNSSVKSEIYFL